MIRCRGMGGRTEDGHVAVIYLLLFASSLLCISDMIRVNYV